MSSYEGPWEFDPATSCMKRIVIDDTNTRSRHDVRVEYAQEVEPIIEAVGGGEGSCGPLHDTNFQYVGSLPTTMVANMMDQGIPVLGQEVDESYLRGKFKGELSKFKGFGKF